MSVWGKKNAYQWLNCCSVEEELKRLHEALGDDSYGAVGFSYDKGEGQQDYQGKGSCGCYD